jgi:hypothetical protein
MHGIKVVEAIHDPAARSNYARLQNAGIASIVMARSEEQSRSCEKENGAGRVSDRA